MVKLWQMVKLWFHEKLVLSWLRSFGIGLPSCWVLTWEWCLWVGWGLLRPKRSWAACVRLVRAQPGTSASLPPPATDIWSLDLIYLSETRDQWREMNYPTDPSKTSDLISSFQTDNLLTLTIHSITYLLDNNISSNICLRAVIIWYSCHAESQKPRRRVGIADQKVFARPESFAHIYKITHKM